MPAVRHRVGKGHDGDGRLIENPFRLVEQSPAEAAENRKAAGGTGGADDGFRVVVGIFLGEQEHQALCPAHAGPGKRFGDRLFNQLATG